jgi:hypothetical protein
MSNLLRSYIHTRIPLRIRLHGCKGHRGIMIVFKRPAARALANHAEVMHTARRLWTEGVVIEQSGNGTVREQMTLFASTVVLFGPHGAGMAGSVAMLPGRTMVEVLPEKGTNRLNMCFVTLAHDLGLHYSGCPGLRPGHQGPGLRLRRQGGRVHPRHGGAANLARAARRAQRLRRPSPRLRRQLERLDTSHFPSARRQPFPNTGIRFRRV